MSLQTVTDLSDAVPLETNLGLYLKPVSNLKINVQLPKLTAPGQSISAWHVMEKLKTIVRPDTFLNLKALKITPSVIKFEGELETKSSCDRALARLKAAGSIEVNGFSDKLQVRAAIASASGPTRHDWEAFYRDAKNLNEMRPGERPDTVHLKDLPIRWFTLDNLKHSQPNDKMVRLAFAGFGKIRRLEIPEVKGRSSDNSIGKAGSLSEDFEVYIQYEEYVEFSIAMDSLRGRKLLYKDSSGKVYSADIKVDFDRTKYLSELSIKKREAEERKLKACQESKEKELSKGTSSSANTTKQNEHAPEKTKSSDETSIENADQMYENLKVAQLEAEFLLGELLLKAEKTEKLKRAKQTHKAVEHQKRPQDCTFNEECIKKLKCMPERTCAENVSTQVKNVKKENKVHNRTHSEENKTEKIQTKPDKNYKEGHRESVIVSKISEKHSKLEKSRCNEKTSNSSSIKISERHPKFEENRYKEKVNSYSSMKNKDKHLHSEKKKSSKSSSPERRDKGKRYSSSCDKTSKDYYYDKKHKSSEISRNCDNRNKINDKSKNEKSSKIRSHKSEKADDKIVYVEVNLEKKMEEEQKRMYMQEKKLKERLMQSYYQNKRNKEKLLEQERILKEKLLKNLKVRQQEELRKKLSGTKVLKSVVGDGSSSTKKY